MLTLLWICWKNSLMEFPGEYFQQTFGIIMGTNVANLSYKTRKIPKEKSINNPKMVWPIFF